MYLFLDLTELMWKCFIRDDLADQWCVSICVLSIILPLTLFSYSPFSADWLPAIFFAFFFFKILCLSQVTHNCLELYFITEFGIFLHEGVLLRGAVLVMLLDFFCSLKVTRVMYAQTPYLLCFNSLKRWVHRLLFAGMFVSMDVTGERPWEDKKVWINTQIKRLE